MQLGGTVKAYAFYASSDKRLKENIQDFDYEKSILDIPVKTYTFKSDETHKKQIGIIAQDLQEIYPEFVSQGDDGYLAISEGKIVYLLMEELKKQNKKIDELEDRLKKLEEKAGE